MTTALEEAQTALGDLTPQEIEALSDEDTEQENSGENEDDTSEEVDQADEELDEPETSDDDDTGDTSDGDGSDDDQAGGEGGDEVEESDSEGEESEADDSVEDTQSTGADVQETQSVSKLPQYALDDADHEAQLTAIGDQLGQLAKDLESGEITETQYASESHKLNDARTDIIVERKINAHTERINQANAINDWERSVEAYFAQPENAVFKDNEALNNMISAEVGRLNNLDESADLGHAELLAKAGDNVREALGLLVPKVESKAEPEQELKPKVNVDEIKRARDKKNARKPLPKTLSSSPAADENQTSEFADIDNMNGEDQEVALAKMSEAQQERYYKGG